jgi:hypothetical protein
MSKCRSKLSKRRSYKHRSKLSKRRSKLSKHRSYKHKNSSKGKLFKYGGSLGAPLLDASDTSDASDAASGTEVNRLYDGLSIGSTEYTESTENLLESDEISDESTDESPDTLKLNSITTCPYKVPSSECNVDNNCIWNERETQCESIYKIRKTGKLRSPESWKIKYLKTRLGFFVDEELNIEEMIICSELDKFHKIFTETVNYTISEILKFIDKFGHLLPKSFSELNFDDLLLNTRQAQDINSAKYVRDVIYTNNLFDSNSRNRYLKNRGELTKSYYHRMVDKLYNNNHMGNSHSMDLTYALDQYGNMKNGFDYIIKIIGIEGVKKLIHLSVRKRFNKAKIKSKIVCNYKTLNISIDGTTITIYVPYRKIGESEIISIKNIKLAIAYNTDIKYSKIVLLANDRKDNGLYILKDNMFMVYDEGINFFVDGEATEGVVDEDEYLGNKEILDLRIMLRVSIGIHEKNQYVTNPPNKQLHEPEDYDNRLSAWKLGHDKLSEYNVMDKANNEEKLDEIKFGLQ